MGKNSNKIVDDFPIDFNSVNTQNTRDTSESLSQNPSTNESVGDIDEDVLDVSYYTKDLDSIYIKEVKNLLTDTIRDPAMFEKLINGVNRLVDQHHEALENEKNGKDEQKKVTDKTMGQAITHGGFSFVFI